MAVATKRVTLDCRKAPNSSCSLTMSGTEDEVLDEGMRHVQAKHNMKDVKREELRGYLQESR